MIMMFQFDNCDAGSNDQYTPTVTPRVKHQQPQPHVINCNANTNVTRHLMQRLHAAAARAMSPEAGVTCHMSHNHMPHYNHMSYNHMSHITLQSHVTCHITITCHTSHNHLGRSGGSGRRRGGRWRGWGSCCCGRGDA